MHSSQLCKVVLVPFQEPLVVAKLVSHKHYLSILTLNVLSTSVVEKEEMKWLRSSANSQSSVLKLRERNTILCRELAWSLIHLTCQSLLEKPLFILVSLWLNTSEIWDLTSV